MEKNIYTREEYDDLRRRHDSYATANMEINAKLQVCTEDLIRVTADRTRMEAELAAMQNTMQMLITDNNTRYTSANAEVEKLRNLLKQHGIEIKE